MVGTTTGRGSMHLRPSVRPSVVDHPGPGAWGAAGKVKAGHVKRLFFQRNRASRAREGKRRFSGGFLHSFVSRPAPPDVVRRHWWRGGRAPARTSAAVRVSWPATDTTLQGIQAKPCDL